MEYKSLPNNIQSLLEKLNAPNRLIRHLQIVHSVADGLIQKLHDEWPSLPLKNDLVLFGAATHDIGKVIFQEELFHKGKRHELAGRNLLVENGFSEDLSRFALTHGSNQWEELPMEDLLVATADKIWKGKRVHELEEELTRKLAELLKVEYWTVFTPLDAILDSIALGADARILWQAGE